MTADSSNNIDKRDSYLQSSNSLNSKDENENTMNELNRKVSSDIKSAENHSQSAT